MNHHYWQQHPAVQPDSTDFVRERTQSSLQTSLQETARTAGHMVPDRMKETHQMMLSLNATSYQNLLDNEASSKALMDMAFHRNTLISASSIIYYQQLL